MVVLVVVILFALFVVIDLLTERHRRAELLRLGEGLHNAFQDLAPRWVAGFKLPLALSYHRGHTWVHWVSPDQAYVGLDDFARRLVGSKSTISAPILGTQIHQGDEVIKVRRNNAEAHLISPVAGEVIEVNPRIADDPEILFRDNYGRGWLYRIRSPRLFKEIPGLLNGSLADRWMEDTRDHFQRRLMLATGSVIQDGGTSVEDIADSLDKEVWPALVGEFLIPQAKEKEEEVR